MAVKRRLTSIRVDKIAAVDKPCQAPATVAIIKRAPAVVPPAIAKATFEEALRAELVSETISETFWAAFERQWAVRDAFRTALEDELSGGGDGTAAVDGFTAAMKQIAVAAAQAARDAASTAPTDLNEAVEDAVTKWLAQQQQENLPMKYINKAALVAAVSTFAFAKASAADFNDLTDAAVEFDALDALDGQPELLAAATAKARARNVEALSRDVDILKMDADTRAFFDGLNDTARTAFLAKSAADRKADVDAANQTDPVVYKCADGTVIRKSDGATAARLAKRQDEQDRELAELRAGATADGFEKRAITDYPNIAKSVAVDMLKSAKQVGEDSDAGKAIIKSLTAMNKAQGGVFNSLGSNDDNPVIEKSQAVTRFNDEVDKVAARDGIAKSAAMSKVRADQPELYDQAYPTTVAA